MRGFQNIGSQWKKQEVYSNTKQKWNKPSETGQSNNVQH